MLCQAMAYILQSFFIDPDGKGEELPHEGLMDKHVDEGYIWIHMHGPAEETKDWLTGDKTVDAVATRVLLSNDARPRTIAHENNILINLRGVNLNPGSKPEDMVGIRFFVERDRIISVERRPLRATDDIAQRIRTQITSKTPGGFLATFALTLVDRMNPTIVSLNERVDELEEKVDGDDDADTTGCRETLSILRREAIMLRRYLAPQRDALNTLALQNVDWITDDDRLRIRDSADQATRITEELEAIRERCAIVKDQLVDQRAEEMNRNMMLLSIVAAIFLPLGLISGMMGINVGGMPWTQTDMGFWYVTAIVILIGVLQLIAFRILRWL